ncbi:MAG: methylmalonyl-CoA epimerase [Candidatus Sericytochromatia bacterium]|nr:methylmalonyl-CoA epimerase [Candidatus Sericytochromatia bacterium]
MNEEVKKYKIDHIAIAVKDLDESLKFYRDILGLKLESIEIVKDQKVKTAFLPIGDTHIELLQAIEPDSPVGKFIEKKGEGIHHIAFKVENIEEHLNNLEENDVKLIDKKAKIGAKNKKIAFIHPKSTSGVLLELCEEDDFEASLPIL